MRMKSKQASKLDPKRFKRFARGAFVAKAGETEARNTKVRISILIDLDVLNFFKERAAKAGAPAYQTQINQVLRAQLESNQTADAKTLAHDDHFIRAVAKRVKELSTKRPNA